MNPRSEEPFAEDPGTARRRRLIWAGSILVGLAAVAVVLLTPTPVCHSSCNRAAQSGLRNGVAAAKVCFTDEDSYQRCDAAAIGQIEPALTFVDGSQTSDNPRRVSVSVVQVGESRDGPNFVVGLAAYSTAGECFYLRDDPMTGTTFGQKEDRDGADCLGSDAIGVSQDGWE